MKSSKPTQQSVNSEPVAASPATGPDVAQPDERAEFEKWAQLSKWKIGANLDRLTHDQNEYRYAGTQVAWEAWQAGRSALAEQARQLEIANLRIATLTKMLRYIAFVLTGDENRDAQLAADKAAEQSRQGVSLETAMGFADSSIYWKNRAEAAEARTRELREALRHLFGAMKNEMVVRGLPLEWSKDSAMGEAECVLAGGKWR